jgi:hypothetical protein
MSLNNPKSGLNNAAEFQSSALPYVTSSQAMSATTYRYDFDKITRFIFIKNHGANGESIRVGFTKNGVEGGNYYIVDGSTNVGTEASFELRVKQLFIRSHTAAAPHFSLMVGLTNIDASMMPQLSGTLDDGSAGWTGIG